MRKRLFILSAILSFCAFCGPAAWAQEAPAPGQAAEQAPVAPQRRPKIGLALSGGGARGATHVAVLRELERMRVPIDYIAGTSMGAIVGGLYASGMSPDGIEKVLLNTDWDAIFKDKPARKDLEFRRKEDDRRYIDYLKAGVKKKGLEIGQGLVNGQELMFLLESLMEPVATIEDFDHLPIPFRCPATDLATGDEIIFSKGHLPLAIRTSMSLPAVFTPVPYEGRLLVDGGVVDNLPVDIVKAMGSDIVIAVDIGTPPRNVSAINSPVAVTGQVLAILQQKQIDAQAARADILIRPDLGGYSNMDFVHAASLLPIGLKSTQEKADALAKLSVPEEEYAPRIARLRQQKEKAAVVEFVRFEGLSPKQEELVRRRISTKAGQPLDLAKLREDITTVYNSGEFQSANYRLASEGGQEGIVIVAKPNPLAPILVSFGLNLSTDFSRQSDWAVLAGLRWIQLNSLGAEWKTDLQIGLNRHFNTEFYQPLDAAAHWFVAPVLDTSSTMMYLYQGNQAVASYRTNLQSLGADLGYHFGKYGEIRLGPRWGHASFSQDLGSAPYNHFSANVSGLSLQATFDQLNNADMPTQGYLFKASGYESLKSLGSTDQFNRGQASWAGYQTWGKNTLIGGLAAGSAFGSDLPPYAWFRLGGLPNFGGYQEGQIVGRYFTTARLGYERQVSRLPVALGEGVYIVAFTDVGNAWQNSKNIGTDLKYSGTLAFGTVTKFGPMYIGYSLAKGGFSQFSILLGKRF